VVSRKGRPTGHFHSDLMLHLLSLSPSIRELGCEDHRRHLILKAFTDEKAKAH
jgi:hypothetical protein